MITRADNLSGHFSVGVEEIHRRSVVESLLIELAGKGDPMTKIAAVKPKVEDEDLLGVDLTNDDIAQPAKSINTRKRKSTGEAPAQSPRKTKLKMKEE
ncbi:hypothetical protein DDE82_002755 [Stemphylium lycopersici]|uniref:Uncharacterized protein n=1 Tax=Stemphylium lycopersici TaxID=183478 RepID=A0A364N187_STELY|nr:hypothetical protein TW65_08966 [Stemphylium lycopersici]RAR07470.1 hypothetical protein DDE82_002755 [Stemphylium lycopersici]RAR09233.1 hypothetical protein DDE83_005605 [Stemphylium lycopersici]